MRQLQTSTGSHMFLFDSQLDLVSYVDPRMFKKGNDDFVGARIESFYDADMKTKAPWPEGKSVTESFVERLRNAAIPELKSRVRKTAWSYDEGDEIDVERQVAGLPYRRSTVREQTQGPGEMTVVIDTTTPCIKKSNDILWRGAAAIALTHILEEKGYRVEVWVVNGSYLYADDRSPVMTATRLKRTEDPLDISTLTSTVSGWFYRSLTFALLETICEKNDRPVAYGYGTCAEPMPKDLDSVSLDQLRVYASGVFSFDGALQLILEEVERVASMSNGDDAASKAEMN